MVVRRFRQALPSVLVLVVLAAAISIVSAQEGSLFTVSSAAQATTAAMVGGGGAVAGEGTDVDLTVAEQTVIPPVTVAQTPPPPAGTSEEATAATPQPILLSQRPWSDEHTTIVECTGEVPRTCQVNVYGPNGEFILGRKISPSGEAADCSGPCLDSTGAPLDASSVSRAQAAIATGSQTHKVIVSAGAPLPPATVETTEVPPSDVEAEPIRMEGE